MLYQPRFMPYKVWCEAGETYIFDTTGESTTQPWAESETFCQERGFAPMLYQPRHTGWKLICACKHSPTRPLADGTWVLLRLRRGFDVVRASLSATGSLQFDCAGGLSFVRVGVAVS